MKATRKPLFCRLGWHRSKFMDSAGFVGAMRCNDCLDWIDKDAGADVDAFRQAISSGELTYKPDTSKCWESHDGTIQRPHTHATDGSIVPASVSPEDRDPVFGKQVENYWKDEP